MMHSHLKQNRHMIILSSISTRKQFSIFIVLLIFLFISTCSKKNSKFNMLPLEDILTAIFVNVKITKTQIS